MKKLLITILLLALSGCASYPASQSIEEKTSIIFTNLKAKFHYKTDMVLYGVEDYHATAAEFLAHNMSGDCEGFAIYAQKMLADAGIKSRKIRVTNFGDDPHLIVQTENGWVLDNRLVGITTLDQLTYHIAKF